MEQRPKLDIPLTPLDRVIEVISLLIMVALWCFTLFSYFKLPEIIPIHFDVSGNINKWGNKNTLIFLPVTATVIFIGLTILNKHPDIFNYPGKVTTANAAQQYTLATRMLRALKLSIAVIFSLISVFAYFAALRKTEKWGPWLLPTVVTIILLPVLYFIFKMLASKSGKYDM